jgi:beta-lactam-binding protein with PASTA domain
MIRFIFSKKFLINAVIAAFLIAGALAGSYFYLKTFTRPDAVVEVPGVVGFDIIEAEALLKNAKLQGVVVDSIFLKGKPGGEITQQNPEENSSVKENRKIYLTITRFSTPMVKLPNVFRILAVGLPILNSYGFEIIGNEKKPSECNGCIEEVLYKGKKIRTGEKIPEGAKLVLVIGSTESGELMSVPELYGLDTAEAKTFLMSKGLNLGAVPCPDCETAVDSASAVIYRQIPEPDEETKISVGSSIDVFLTSDSSLIPPVNLDSIKALIPR